MYVVVLIALLFSMIIFSNISFAYDNMTTIQSPMKQIRAGVHIQDVKCNPGNSLLIRPSDGNPVCVKSSHFSRFLEHGWITPEKFVTVHNLLINNGTNNTTAQENSETISKNITNQQELGKPIQNENNITNNGTANQNKTYYPVYQAQREETVKVSDLPPISEIPPVPAVSTTSLTIVTEPTTINYSKPYV